MSTDPIAAAVARLEPVPLAGVGRAALLDRVDTKYLLPVAMLPDLLERCASWYRVLEVGGARLRRYRTQYFDTAELFFYHSHHAGRRPRYKVRVRSYLETDQHFLEVKLKSNRNRSIKSRLPLDGRTDRPLELLREAPLLGVASQVSPDALRATIAIDYTRITLVAADRAERVTLDFRLEFRAGARTLRHPALVIAEVKQQGSARSRFRDAMRAAGIRETRVSKYCLGVASLVEGVRRNRFKQLLVQVQHPGEYHVAQYGTSR